MSVMYEICCLSIEKFLLGQSDFTAEKNLLVSYTSSYLNMGNETTVHIL